MNGNGTAPRRDTRLRSATYCKPMGKYSLYARRRVGLLSPLPERGKSGRKGETASLRTTPHLVSRASCGRLAPDRAKATPCDVGPFRGPFNPSISFTCRSGTHTCSVQHFLYFRPRCVSAARMHYVSLTGSGLTQKKDSVILTCSGPVLLPPMPASFRRNVKLAADTR